MEAVVVRQLRTQRLFGFKASALLAFGDRVQKGKSSSESIDYEKGQRRGKIVIRA